MLSPAIGVCLLHPARGPLPETPPEVDTPRRTPPRCHEALRRKIDNILTISGESIDAEAAAVILPSIVSAETVPVLEGSKMQMEVEQPDT